MDIGKYIKNILESKGYTQRQLADKLNIDEKRFSYRLTNNSLSANELIKIAEILNLDLNELKNL
jgi:transcriptional regulator with XRE-family HTH domain